MNPIIRKQLSLETAYHLLADQINPFTGVVEWVRQLPTPYAKDAFAIYIAKHPLSRSVNSLAGLIRQTANTSSAIGKTPRMAKILSICEAFERWSCVSQGNEKAIRATYAALESEAIHPALLHGFSEKQYAGRIKNNKVYRTGGGYIPEQLPDDKEVLWCPVYDVVNKQTRYVLKASAYFGHSDDGHHYVLADSRGVAAGPSREFCVWQGMLELIETDAGAIWNANAIQRPAVDIGSFDDPYLNTLVKIHSGLGRSLWALDISMDIAGIVVMAAISCDLETGTIITGFGTHPVAAKALEKALMECCQMLPNAVQPATNAKQLPGRVNQWIDKTRQIHVEASPHFRPAPDLVPRTAACYPSEPEIRTIHQLTKALQKVGITPLIQDVSRPELQLCVMRVFAPGMRSWFRRKGPGRLYDVPVQLSLRDTPLTEDTLFDEPVEL